MFADISGGNNKQTVCWRSANPHSMLEQEFVPSCTCTECPRATLQITDEEIILAVELEAVEEIHSHPKSTAVIGNLNFVYFP